jgi:hypothetical protein
MTATMISTITMMPRGSGRPATPVPEGAETATTHVWMTDAPAESFTQSVTV